MGTIYISLLSVILFTSFSCSQDKEQDSSKTGAQQKNIIVGGKCEGCEAVHESPIPFEQLNWIDTLPDFNDAGPQLEISGVIYKSDGITPAPGIVVYFYHTDQSGHYPKRGDETGWDRRHGYIRGWIKTNDNGEYKLYTLRPGTYPSRDDPAHIHSTVKEPDKNEYWIDDYVFDDDPLVNERYRKAAQNRSGSGIITLIKNENGMLTGKRDLILGKNIPGYEQ